MPMPASAAHFWLSAKASGVPGPANAAVTMAPTEQTTLYVWGRPTAGEQLRNLSLNVVATATGVDFVDGTYAIDNTIDGATDRFEYVRDSASAPTLTSEASAADVGMGSVDALYGLNAFTLVPSDAYRGFGPACSAGEARCETAGDGEPAWRLASFTIEAIAGGVVDLHLQVGERGMNEQSVAAGDYDYNGLVETADYDAWVAAFGAATGPPDGNADGVVDGADYTLWRDHLGNSGVLGVSADVEVRFGVDPGAGLEPWHNALTDRGVNLAGDDADAVITIAAPATAVPEPGVARLAAAGLAGWLSTGRSRTRRNARQRSPSFRAVRGSMADDVA